MRILHCFSGNMYGGVEVFLTTLARHRHLHPKLDQQFALSFEGRLSSELDDAGATVHRLGAVRWSRPWTVLSARRRLRQLLSETPPDVMISHACWPHTVFGPVARQTGRPLVFWAHDAPVGTHWLERCSKWTPPDLVVANSRFTASRLPLLFPGVRHEVLYYPVAPPPPAPPEQRAQTRRDLGAADGEIVIVQACRLERWKGHTSLIAALGRLRDRPGWSAWIAGGVQRPHEQVYLDELKQQVKAQEISDRVQFLGQRSDVSRLLAAADIHCQPNTGPEPFGIAFLEALHAGLPVVTTRQGAAPEIVDESCGVLTPPNDPDTLADALSALIADPAARARLGAAGPARARQLCDPEVVIGGLGSLLENLIGSKPNSARPRPQGALQEAER